MRTSIFLVAAVGLVGCGNNTSNTDMSVTGMDMSMMAAVDMTGAVTPYNHPGMIDCYQGLMCSTSSATPVCCDAPSTIPDAGGFSDTCVASAAACTGPKTTAYACGQAADCGAGMVCCATIGMSKSGKKFFNGGTVCEASCTTGQTQLCVTATECKSGTMCSGIAIEGRDVGLCM